MFLADPDKDKVPEMQRKTDGTSCVDMNFLSGTCKLHIYIHARCKKEMLQAVQHYASKGKKLTVHRLCSNVHHRLCDVRLVDKLMQLGHTHLNINPQAAGRLLCMK